MIKKYLFLPVLLLSPIVFAHTIDFSYHQKTLALRSWKDIRDDGIVKQDLDYSCGAASVATLLNNYFYQKTTEEQILNIMDKGELKASFLDMQKALATLGFRAQGLAVSYDTLKTLKAPVIVYVKHRKNDHFSVIRGINERFVWLADPSLGNRILSKEQFIQMWHTRDDPLLSGKILAVMPHQGQITNPNYFTHQITPPNQHTQSITLKYF